MAKYTRDAERLLKLLVYILGRHPDELGLVPARDGFVKIKDLLKAICEEDGWRHIRLTHIDQLFLTLSDPPLERKDRLIRARDRENLPDQAEVKTPPALLYNCVRKRAYPAVCEKGINGMGAIRVILSANRQMAKRIGRRYDHNAVLLTVNTRQCQAAGVQFNSAGELFWAAKIPHGCFTGPPLPEEKPSSKKTSPERSSREKQSSPTPGSFILDPFAKKKGGRGKKTSQKRKDGAKKWVKKKMKRKRQPPPWRS